MAIQRIFPATDGPASHIIDPVKYSLGVEFYPTVDCQLTAFYYWMSNILQSHANRIMRLYQCVGGDFADYYEGTEINTGTDWVDGVWNRFPLSIPPLLVANQRYRAVIFCDDNNCYSATTDFWTTDIVNGFLTAPSADNAFGTDQGQFFAGATEIQYPLDSFGKSNYWIDVELNDELNFAQADGALDNFPAIISPGII